MKLRILFSVLSASLIMTGCATASGGNTPAPDTGTPTLYIPAANADTQKVVTQYIPVAVPGQLMPIPSQANLQTPKFKSAIDAVDYANQQATETPTNSSQFFNSMMTYDYMQGSLYTIYCAPMKITDITLAPGEKLISEAAGDTLRWQIAQTYSGSGDNLTQHILVKPNQPGLQNTMVITTDQRVYHLILQSTNQSYMAAVSWNYPGDMVNYASNSSNPSVTPPDSSPNVDLTNLDFSYHTSLLDGKITPAWFPTRVFNDGKQTFIQLPNNYSPSQLPVLYVADENGNYGSMVNWRYRAPYIIVDVVVQQARLQSGVNSTGSTVVQISHN